MRLLLDTHILIWFLEGNRRLSNARRRTIGGAQNEVFLSIASLWEMAIKISIGKLTLAHPLAAVSRQIAAENIEILPIAPKHVLQVSNLLFHHRDPFDRLLIAQTQIENLPIMTDDKIFAAYGVKVLS